MSTAARSGGRGAPVRRMLAALIALVLLVGGTGAAAAQPPAPAADRADRTVTIMSRNLYLGADLSPIFGAQDLTELLAAVPLVWGRILATDFPTRAEALADEVVATRPDLIGLQEVTRYSTAPLGDPGNETVVLDFLEVLMAELAARGQVYRVVAEVENFNGVQPNLAIGAFLRLVDRDVILARVDRRAGELMVSNPQSANFAANLAIPVQFQADPLVVLRGWVSVDVRTRGLVFRFVNTHLEAFDPFPMEGLRRAQVAELLAGPLDTPLPVVLAGDINSAAPGGPAYQMLLAGGLWDPWTALHPGEPGFTCCHDDDLRNEQPDLRSRIDVVLATPGFRAVAVEVVGDEPGDRIDGLWPSDHAGVVTTLILDPPRSSSR